MRIRSVLAIGTAIAITACTFTAPADNAMATDDWPACTATTFVSLRGSGETQATAFENGDFPSNGWEGNTIARAYGAYRAAVDEIPATVRTLNIGEAQGYAAIDVLKEAVPHGIAKAAAAARKDFAGPFGNPLKTVATSPSYTLAEIMASAKNGAESALTTIQRDQAAAFETGCPSPKYVTIGYSQGAMASRILLAGSPDTDPVKAIMTFGDPLQIGQPSRTEQRRAGLEGDGASGTGLYNKSSFSKRSMNMLSKSQSRRLPQVYQDSNMHKYLLCHKMDPFCDYGMPNEILANRSYHESYATVASERSSIAEWMSKEAGTSGEKKAKNAKEKLTPPHQRANYSLQVRSFTDAHWRSGWEGRLEITGVPHDSPVELELAPWTAGADPWAAHAVTHLTASPGGPGATERPNEFWPDDPARLTGNFGVNLADVAAGTYFLRLATPRGRTAIKVSVLENIGTDFFYSRDLDALTCEPLGFPFGTGLPPC